MSSYVKPLIAALLVGTKAAAGVAAPASLEYARQSIAVAGYEFEMQLPRDLRLEVLTTELEGPRLLTFAANGDLFIGSQSGAVYRLTAPYRNPEVVLALPSYPHSVAFRDREILIAQTDGLYRAPYVLGQPSIAPNSVTVLAELPGGSGHNSRTVRIGPDGRVYVSLGIRGNCSNEHLDASSFARRRGGVVVLQEGSGEPRWATFASGLRNPVGFDWHPTTKVLYASNNGPDHLGFHEPPEYFSRLEPGSFHGMPWYQFDGTQFRRDRCIDGPPPSLTPSPPVATFPARSAPLGVAFAPIEGFDSRLAGDAVVALHGSWATQPKGTASGDPATRRPPMLVAVRFEDGEAERVDALVTGFQLPDGARWGRPAGVAFGPDGALYFTSDRGYRRSVSTWSSRIGICNAREIDGFRHSISPRVSFRVRGHRDHDPDDSPGGRTKPEPVHLSRHRNLHHRARTGRGRGPGPRPR